MHDVPPMESAGDLAEICAERGLQSGAVIVPLQVNLEQSCVLTVFKGEKQDDERGKAQQPLSGKTLLCEKLQNKVGTTKTRVLAKRFARNGFAQNAHIRACERQAF